MLFAIIGTIDGANFVFDRWPRSQQYPKLLTKITAADLSQKLLEYFYYFGMFQKNKILEISSLSLSQKNFIQIFNANQKRLESVLSIDDQYVFISRSIFIVNNQKLFSLNSIPQLNSNFYTFLDINQQKKDIINSITLVWCASSFPQAQSLKNKLAFMIGILNNLQQSQNYLNKQIIKITQTKSNFQKKLKQKQRQLNKDLSLTFQPFQIKQLFQQFYDLAQQSIKSIQIFQQLKKFYYSCINHQQYQININWYSSIGGDFKIPIHLKFKQIQDKKGSDLEKQSKTDQQFTNKQPLLLKSSQKQKQLDILKKTTLTSQKKLQFLPKSLRDQRIHKLYKAALQTHDIPLKQIIQHQQSLNQKSALKTIQFLKLNHACLCVYPFDIKKYYNLYTLKNMPNQTVIKKFNTKIFPKQNILTQIYPFNLFKRINQLDQKLKYLIFQNIIKQVYVYIYYLDFIKQSKYYNQYQQHLHLHQHQQQRFHTFSHDTHLNSNKHIEQQQQQSQSHDEQNNKIDLLLNFINKPYNINQILYEKNQFKNISQLLNFIIQSMNKKKSNHHFLSQYHSSNLFSKHISQAKQYQDQQIDPLTLPKWGFYYVQMS